MANFLFLMVGAIIRGAPLFGAPLMSTIQEGEPQVLEREMEHRLVLLNGRNPGVSIRLDTEASPLTVGRDTSRDLPVDDHLASRLHARIWFDGNAWQVEDCGSLNGTRVNSQAIERAVLQTGDVIRIGDRLMVFMDDSPDGDSRIGPALISESTRLVRLDTPKKETAILETLGGQKSAAGPVRNLSLLCQLASSLHSQSDLNHVTQLVSHSLQEATGASIINIWISGINGRLRRIGGIPKGNTDKYSDHLLASLVMEQDEALLLEAESLNAMGNSDNDESSARKDYGIESGSAISAPIPGRKHPRGAVECYLLTQGTSFDRHDLEFAVAVAHQFGMALENLEYRERLERNNENLRRRVSSQTRLLGNCPDIRQLHDQISRVAPTSSTVLILGESGTGKELVAQTLHEMSSCASGPFIAVNCASFSESLLESELFGHEPGSFTGADQRRLGQFERAHRGTIFLDEVAEMSAACQAKLLRILEGHPFYRLGGNEPIQVDVRLVAATHRDLPAMIEDGSFRNDLYYRLRVIELRMPPLRERGEDILDLAVQFLERFRHEIGRGPSRLSVEAANAIMTGAWPGNVRELKNAIERAVVLGKSEEVLADDLGLGSGQLEATGSNRLTTLEVAEREHINFVLKSVDGNKTRACQILGIGRGTLYKKLATWNKSKAS